jgi:hypothetical protein
MCFDGFNPYRMREAGKKVSSGAIYLVCLNLPPSIRYKVENICLVGIIPGPRELSQHQINHLIRPVVDDLVVLWHKGVQLTWTASLPKTGQLIHAALGPLVCDLPAARQMSGFASCSHLRFCSFCHQTIRDIEDLDWQSWRPWTRDEHYKSAVHWQDAQSTAERANIYTETGVRWSELLRLPYWDATKFIVIDSMHALLLSHLKRQCRDIWGMDTDFKDGPGITFDKVVDLASVKQVQEGMRILREGSLEQLQKLPEKVLYCICHELQTVRFAGRKKYLLKNLIQYVSSSFWLVQRLHRLTARCTENRSWMV